MKNVVFIVIGILIIIDAILCIIGIINTIKIIKQKGCDPFYSLMINSYYSTIMNLTLLILAAISMFLLMNYGG